MLSKHFMLSVCFHILVSFESCWCVDIAKSHNNLKVWRNVVKLTDTLLEVTPYINITISGIPPNCVQMVCKFVCFNGQSGEIDRDIDIVATKNNYACNRIEELRLYSYEFPDNKLSYGFLGTYSDKVEILYLASSNISDVDAGTFANGVFQKIYFENLQLVQLKKEFFQDITGEFQSLSVVQKGDPLKVVNVDFLDHVKYQIKYLSMQVGLSCVRNLTGSENLLNNLIHVDFSYNNFGDRFTSTIFNKLSMVEHMDLSHSNLEYLPAYIFADFTTTLEYLDLSHNRLTTITRDIFGWHDIPRDLKIYANDNEWLCSCWLQGDMKEIFVYQTTQLVCSGPEAYANWSLFDDNICDESLIDPAEEDSTMLARETTVKMHGSGQQTTSTSSSYQEDFEKPFAKETTEAVVISSTTPRTTNGPATTTRPDLVELQCATGPQQDNYSKHPLKWPPLEFHLRPQDQLGVEVVIDNPTSSSSSSYSSSSSAEDLDKSVGLIWFSKVTTQYYKMEINYNEYGLGCYKSISYVNTVNELLPNVAYTFCMVLKDELTVSPFNCKSIHVGSNLSIHYSAWLTRDMKVTGLSLVILGIVMFSFAGILMIYLLLKRKPILLKGSKRVTMTGTHSGDIVVMPRAKSMKLIKDKEKKLAIKSHLFCAERRRHSSESVASYQSYMNTNVYEVIPAAYTKITYQAKMDTSSLDSQSTIAQQVVSTTTDVETGELDACYLTPLNTVSSSADLVNYAEIPYRSKRVSNDPLPEVPADQQPFYGASLGRSACPDVGIIYMLDSQV